MTSPAYVVAAPGEAAGARQVPARRRPPTTAPRARGRVRPRHRRAPACAAGSVGAVLVVTDDARFAARPAAAGCATIPDGVAGDLNATLRQAAAEARAALAGPGAGRAVRRPAGLRADDLDAALAGAAAGAPAFVADAAGVGHDALHRAARRVRRRGSGRARAPRTSTPAPAEIDGAGCHAAPRRRRPRRPAAAAVALGRRRRTPGRARSADAAATQRRRAAVAGDPPSRALASGLLGGAFFAGAFLAGAFLAGAFLAGAFLAGAFLAAVFLAGAAFFAGLLGRRLLGRRLLGRSGLLGRRLLRRRPSSAGAFLAGAFLAGGLLGRRRLLGRGLLGRPSSSPGPAGCAFLAAAVAGAASVSFGSFLAPETTFFRSAPALNFGTAVFLALIRSPVCGLRTQRASRTRFSNDAEAGDRDLLALGDLAGDRVEDGLERVLRPALRFPS